MDNLKQLSESELKVMEIIWSNTPPVSRSDIEKDLLKEKDLAPSTIITFLTRLCEKGVLSLEKHGRTNLYTPLISRDEYLGSIGKSFLDRFFNGSISSFALSLSGKKLSDDDIKELRKLLEEDRL